MASSKKGTSQPSWEKPPDGSSPAPPGACMTPSRVTNVVTTSVRMATPPGRVAWCSVMKTTNGGGAHRHDAEEISPATAPDGRSHAAWPGRASDAEQQIADLLQTARKSLRLSVAFLSRLDGTTQHLEVVDTSVPVPLPGGLPAEAGD